MCVVCSASGGNIGTASALLLTYATAFSPLFGMFVYRIIKATSLLMVLANRFWYWRVGVMNMVNDGVFFGVSVGIGYGLLPYTRWWIVVVMIFPFILLAYWVWFLRKIVGLRGTAQFFEITVVTILSVLPFITVALGTYHYSTVTNNAYTKETITFFQKAVYEIPIYLSLLGVFSIPALLIYPKKQKKNG